MKKQLRRRITIFLMIIILANEISLCSSVYADSGSKLNDVYDQWENVTDWHFWSQLFNFTKNALGWHYVFKPEDAQKDAENFRLFMESNDMRKDDILQVNADNTVTLSDKYVDLCHDYMIQNMNSSIVGCKYMMSTDNIQDFVLDMHMNWSEKYPEMYRYVNSLLKNNLPFAVRLRQTSDYTNWYILPIYRYMSRGKYLYMNEYIGEYNVSYSDNFYNKRFGNKFVFMDDLENVANYMKGNTTSSDYQYDKYRKKTFNGYELPNNYDTDFYLYRKEGLRYMDTQWVFFFGTGVKVYFRDYIEGKYAGKCRDYYTSDSFNIYDNSKDNSIKVTNKYLYETNWEQKEIEYINNVINNETNYNIVNIVNENNEPEEIKMPYNDKDYTVLINQRTNEIVNNMHQSVKDLEMNVDNNVNIITKALNKIGDMLAGIGNVLKEVFEWLFVPSDDFLDWFMTNTLDKLKGNVSILLYPFSLIYRFYEELDNCIIGDCIFKIPDIQVMGHTIMESMEYNLSAEIRNNEIYAELYNYYLKITDFLMVMGLVSLARRKYNSFLDKNSNE